MLANLNFKVHNSKSFKNTELIELKSVISDVISPDVVDVSITSDTIICQFELTDEFSDNAAHTLTMTELLKFKTIDLKERDATAFSRFINNMTNFQQMTYIEDFDPVEGEGDIGLKLVANALVYLYNGLTGDFEGFEEPEEPIPMPNPKKVAEPMSSKNSTLLYSCDLLQLEINAANVISKRLDSTNPLSFYLVNVMEISPRAFLAKLSDHTIVNPLLKLLRDLDNGLEIPIGLNKGTGTSPKTSYVDLKSIAGFITGYSLMSKQLDYVDAISILFYFEVAKDGLFEEWVRSFDNPESVIFFDINIKEDEILSIKMNTKNIKTPPVDSKPLPHSGSIRLVDNKVS